MSKDQVRALLFDVFGTVVDWRSGIIREMEEYGARVGEERDWAAVADFWRGRYQPSMERVRSGARGYVKLDTLHRENLLETLEAFDLPVPEEPALGHLVRAWHRLDPWPDAPEGLGRLKSRYIIGTLSNGNIALMVNMAKRGGLPWDVILGSEVSRAYKPQPECYLRSAAALDLPPEACMMTAAHNGDLRAARALGFKCAFVLRPNEHGPGQGTDLKAEEDWDVVADSFTDLAARMGC